MAMRHDVDEIMRRRAQSGLAQQQGSSGPVMQEQRERQPPTPQQIAQQHRINALQIATNIASGPGHEIVGESFVAFARDIEAYLNSPLPLAPASE